LPGATDPLDPVMGKCQPNYHLMATDGYFNQSVPPPARSGLAGQLWPESTEVQAQTNLRRELHHLREGWPKLDALVDAGAAVAGPALFWDDGYRWLLPPAELHTRSEIIDRAVASRWRMWAARRDRRRFRARLAFWEIERTTRVRAISGAVMAIRAKAFDEAGGFDERFHLYFEESDFLRRVRGEIAYVPAARCRHLYNQSAAGSAEAVATRPRYFAHWAWVTAVPAVW
jgi:hypothetical protein